jgi:hypothetical protein
LKTTKDQLERSIRHSLSLLDDRTFERMCDNGKKAILEMAKLVDFDVSDFVPEQDWAIEFSSGVFTIPHNENITDYTAKLVVTNKSKKVVYEEEISQHDFYPQ